MRKPAKIRIAGMIAATLPPLLWCAAATSQTLPSSTVHNDQVQLGDVFSTQVIDVVEPAEVVVAATTALGNGVTVTTDGTAIDVQSRQRLEGDVRASTTLNGTGSVGWNTVATTSAVGNAGLANTVNGGTVSGSFKQEAGAVTVRAGTGIFADYGYAGDISGGAQTVVNSQGLGASGGSTINASVDQSSQAVAEASTGVHIKYVPGSANFSGTTVNNNVTASGENGSTMNLAVRQNASGDHTQGTVFVSGGTIQSVSAAASAVANNVSVNNYGGPAAVSTDQTNSSYVRAQAVNNTDSFGASTTLAYGVGNSVLVGEFGPELTLDNNQVNSGGVSAIAEAGGREGYDMSAQSTAIGNAATGFVCSECGGVINVNNRQVNSSNVVSTTNMSISGPNRSVSGTATAVGNTATFYATRPSG
jgi:hypothetical protein